MKDNFESIKKLAYQLTCNYESIQYTDNIKEILNQCDKYQIDAKIIIGIYLIEKNFRPAHKRFIEYSFLVIEWVLNKFLKKPLKNYTLGPFQIGITSILFYQNRRRLKIHDRTIKKLDLQDMMFVIYSCRFENNLDICCKIIKSILNSIQSNWGERETNIGRVGQTYNGNINYGVLLYEIVQNIDL